MAAAPNGKVPRVRWRMSISRRDLIARSVAGLGVAVLGRSTGLLGTPASAAPGGYGPLSPTPPATGGEPVLALPEGFTYRTFGVTGALMLTGPWQRGGL